MTNQGTGETGSRHHENMQRRSGIPRGAIKMTIRRMAALVGLALAPALFAQTYNFYTIGGIAGTGGELNGKGGFVASPALFAGPLGLAVDSSGNVFVADTNNSAIRKITSTGTVSTFAGQVGISGATDATGILASFTTPEGLAIDSNGNIYAADFSAATIRKITNAGVVTTLAGFAGITGSANGTGTAATFNGPRAVAADKSGNVYVADSLNHDIRKITSGGVVTTLSGIAGTAGHVDGSGTTSTFNYPSGIAVDSSGVVYVADTYNHTIRKVTSDGTATTFAGTTGVAGHTDGTGTAAKLNLPAAISIDANGNLYVSEQGNNDIRKITSAGVVTTLAGGGPVTGYDAGRADGSGTAALFNTPSGLGTDSSGNVFVADYRNNLIRKVTSSGTVSTIAGAGGVAGSLDGSGYIVAPSLFWRPTNLATDASGNIYIADTYGDTIRKIAPDGTMITVAGNSNLAGTADGVGSAANFNGPTGIAVDSAGVIYVTDTYNHSVRQIMPDGTVTTIAGTAGTSGSADGTGIAALFNLPSGIAIDNAANAIYVADYGNHTIRRIDRSNWVVTTYAGTATVPGSADGMGTSASFDFPRDIAYDPSSGNLVVADTGNQTIRRIASGYVTTIAGSTGTNGAVDAAGSSARFDAPSGVAVDSSGNIYVADANNDTIRKVTPAGAVTTIGGTAGVAGSVDGAGSAARFDHPMGVAVDASGNVYVADYNNNTIREGLLPGGSGSPVGGVSPGINGSGGNSLGTTVSTTGINGSGSFMHPGGLAVDSLGNVYVVDTQHNSIKRITTSGGVSTMAGSGSAGSADGKGTAATFNGPVGITIGNGNTLYVTDTGNALIRQITTDGTVTTVAGSATARGNLDGTGTAATFSSPTGITIDSSFGTLYVADSGNHTIRKVTTNGVVTTAAGAAGVPGDIDAIGINARFNNPTGVSIDTNNNLFIADTYNNTIRLMDSLGNVTTFAGATGVSGSYDGNGTYALFDMPYGLAVAGSVIYVTDTGNNTIRGVFATTDHPVFTLAGYPGLAGAADGFGSTALFNKPQAVIYNSLTTFLVVSDTGNELIRYVSTSGVTVTPTFTTDTSSNGTGGVVDTGGGGGAIGGGFILALGGLAAAAALSAARRRRAA
jgi:DNA-binding beta-propeller fold protein YncE